jgi:hypothetical protein
MTTINQRPQNVAASGTLRAGSALMALAGLGFIGYAIIFFVRNFTGAFLELGIGPGQVDVGRTEIREFSLPLFHYIAHLHIAVSGFIAATGLATAALAWYGVRRGELWAYVTAIAGALYIRPGVRLEPLVRGGGQVVAARPRLRRGSVGR